MAIFTTAIGGLLGGTFLSGAVGSFLIKAAVGIGLNLLASAIAGQPEKPRFSVQGQLQAGGDISRSFVLGRTATAGSLVYANTWGQAGKTPNAYFTQVISLADLPSNGIAGIWVNGERCTLLTGSPHAEYGWPVAEYRVNGTDFLWVKFYDGTQTTADSFLVNRVGSVERPYEATRVGVGVSYAVCTARINENLFTGFPAYKFELQGCRLYDLTKDSTAGGSGPHRLDDPATWGGDGDDLPAVQAFNLLLGFRYGSDWFYGLQNMSALRMPAADWRAQIDKCRAQVARPGGGTEEQYLTGLEIQVSAPIADATEAILTGCQGRLIDTGGIYKMRLGAPESAVFAFSDGDILSTEAQTFSPFFGLADTINGISATYPEPEEGWNAKAAPSIFRPDYEVRDGNRRLLANVQLGAVSRASQVQRLMKSALEEARRARRHTLVLGPSAWILEPGDIIAWTSSRNGYEAKLMRVDGVLDKANLDVVLDLTEVDPADYNWNPATDYTPPTFGPIGPARPVAQAIVDWDAQPWTIDDGSGGARRPAIRLSWDGDQEDVAAVAFEVRLSATQEVIYRGRTDNVPAGSIVISQGLLPVETYGVRGRYLPDGDRETLWSGWLAVTTPNALLVGGDIMPGAIAELQLAAQAVSTAKLQVAAVTAEILAQGAVIVSKIADAAVTGAKLAAQAVQATHFAAGIEPVSVIAGSVVPSVKSTEVITVGGALYHWDGTGYVTSVDEAAIADAVADAIAGGIAASAITGQLTDAQIAAVAAAKVTGQIVTSQIADLGVTGAKLAALAVDASKLANAAVTTTKIADDAISTPKLQANAVVADKIATNAITARTMLLADMENLIANGTIADTTAIGNYWGTPSGGVFSYLTAATDPPLVQTGTRSFILQKTDPAGSANVMMLPQHNIPVEAGEVLYGETAIRTNQPSTTAGAYFRVRWFAADGIQLAVPNNYTDIVANAPITTAWTVHSRKITVPAGAAFGRIELFNLNTQTTTQNLILDRLVLRRANAAQLIVDGGIVAGHIAADAVTTSALAAGSVTADIIAANAITTPKIAAGAVQTGHLAAGSVVANTIASGAVTTANLAALSVTSDKVAANSIIAGKIAAGAVNTAQLVAGAVTTNIIAAGAVSTDKLAVGSGANLLQNSTFSFGLDCWHMTPNHSGGAPTFAIRPSTATYAGPNAPTLMVHQAWGNDGGYADIRQTRPDAASLATTNSRYAYSCAPGEWFEATVHVSAHRCAVQLRLAWSADGVEFTYSTAVVNDSVSSSSTNPDLWPRLRIKAQAPAGAAMVGIHIRKLSTNAGQADSFAFLHRPMLCRTTANATEPTVWSEGGVVLITPGGIVANAITANHLATNSVTAGKIAAGAVIAGNIAAGAVTADKIAAGAVTADKMTVANLAAISANFGNATFAGFAQSANGKLKIDFSAATIEVWS